MAFDVWGRCLVCWTHRKNVGLKFMARSQLRAQAFWGQEKCIKKLNPKHACGVKRLWEFPVITTSFHSSGEDRINIGCLDLFSEPLPDLLFTWWRTTDLFPNLDPSSHTYFCRESAGCTPWWLVGWSRLLFHSVHFSVVKLLSVWRCARLQGMKT